jgi:hypothetical protein
VAKNAKRRTERERDRERVKKEKKGNRPSANIFGSKNACAPTVSDNPQPSSSISLRGINSSLLLLLQRGQKKLTDQNERHAVGS